jgi:predicted DNA-binding transcriptional regulator YafY
VRASRLVALLLHLQARGAATASVLADELEVSERTIYRDVADLQAAGVPLWTETGPGGGIRLIEGWRTQLDGLTADEAGALFAAGVPSAVAELGLGTVLTAAQSKVLATLPPELRARAGRMRQRFLVDAPGWFHHDEPVPCLESVAAAVWSGRRLDLSYLRDRRSTRRRVDPLGVVLKAGTWYLVAQHRGRVLTFRVSRIVEARARREHVSRPHDFDLVSYWEESSRSFDRSLLRARVRLRVGPRAQRLLPHLTDPVAAQEALERGSPPDADGWIEVELAVESDEVAHEQLTGLGAEVEVLAPMALRDALARTGARMQANNSSLV